MLNQIFLQVLHMSFTASFVILFILLARIVLQKAPKIFSYILWGVALFRLICPWSFESTLSLLAIGNSAVVPIRIFPEQNVLLETVRGSSHLNGNATISLDTLTRVSESQQQNLWVYLWLIGIAVLVIYSIAALFRMKKQLRDAACDKENIYLSKRLSTPFVMGVIRPKIYLPAFLLEKEKRYILLHEQTHIRRFDHIVKIVSFFVLCLHWFNPLVWLAFFLSDRDREMSCDETVIRKLGNDIKREYSSSLLSLAIGRHIACSTHLAFSGKGAKGRIKNVLNYKKPAFGVTAIWLIVVIAICTVLVPNPVSAFTLDDDVFSYSCSASSFHPEDVLKEKMGFEVHFPNLLGGKYACLDKSEDVGIHKPVSLAVWEALVPDVQTVVNDEEAYKALEAYEPYRGVTGYYGERTDAKSLFAIRMAAHNESPEWDNPAAGTKTKVGDFSAKWIEAEKSFLLTWNAGGIRYELVTVDTEMDISMEDAVKIAESFMAGQ